MDKDYYCNKRCIRIDSDFEICKDCTKRKLSGFEDIQMCKEFNITYISEDKECQ